MIIQEKGSKCLLKYGVLLGAFLFTAVVIAEEGGSGHYTPGSMASSIDGVPQQATFLTRLNILNYDATFKDNELRVPIAGVVATEVDVKSQAVGLTILWRPEWGQLGERWSYAMSTTIPVMSLDVKATVLPPGLANGVRRSDSDSGLGDILVQPVMLNQHISKAWNMNYRVTVYAPTGDYEVGRLANTGKNYWSVEPTVASIYLNPETGREFSMFAGVTFNDENSDTNYQSGDQAHIESTLMQHLPLWGGNGGFGVSAYWYQQITGDSGSGANFGDFKAKTIGAGPLVTYGFKAGGIDITAELKWLHEFDTERRAEGDTVFLKLLTKFY